MYKLLIGYGELAVPLQRLPSKDNTASVLNTQRCHADRTAIATLSVSEPKFANTSISIDWTLR